MVSVLVLCVLAASAGARAHGAAQRSAVPLGLVGTYEAYLPKSAGTWPGRWTIAIGRHGAFVLTSPRLISLAAGPARVEGTTITFPPDVSRHGTCAGPGIYAWRLRAGGVLTFARVDDACRDRAFRLTTRPWRRFENYEPVIIIQG